MICTKKAFQSVKPIDSTLFYNIDIEKYINARTNIHDHVETNSNIDTTHEFYVISKNIQYTCPHCTTVSALEYHNYNLPVYYNKKFVKYIAVKLLSCRLCKRVFMTTAELSGILARLNPMISAKKRLILHPKNIRIKSRNASNGFIYEPIIENNIVVHKNGTRTFYYTSAEDDANIGKRSSKYATSYFSTSNETSFLSDMGYHSYISTEKRHAILLKALETHPPREITDLLNFFISTHGGNYWREQRYAVAIATWEEDRQFVHENRNIWYDKHPRRRY